MTTKTIYNELALGKKESGERHTTNQERNSKMSLESTRMQTGQKMVFTGFGIAVIGIVLYCMAGFSADATQTEPVFIKESLGVIGLGVLVWLIGAVKYMNGAIDSNASDEHSIF